MTSPEDDGLEEALRRALSEAADGVEPGTDGLDKIRARIADRPPRPWLLSVLFGVVERVRFWTWRGHWAWPASLSRLPGPRGPRSRRSNFPRWGLGSLRLAVVLAGIAAIAVVTLGVQPFRQVIIQAGAALDGDNGPQQVSAGTEGNGTPSVEGGSAAAAAAGATPGSGQASTGQTPGAVTAAGTVTPGPAATAKCGTSTLPVVTGAQPSLTDVTPRASGTTPSTQAPSPVTPSPAASVQPDSTTSAATCPVVPATKSAAPTPTSSPSASSAQPDPAPAVTSPSPTYTDPSPAATAPAVTPSTPAYADSPSPSAPPSWWSRPHRPPGGPGKRAYGPRWR